MNQFNYKDIFNNNHLAISRAISLIENNDPHVNNFYKHIYKKSNKSLRIGITGPPGAGDVEVCCSYYIREPRMHGHHNKPTVCPSRCRSWHKTF